MNTFTHPIPVAELMNQSVIELDNIKTAAGFRDIHFQHLCVPVLKAYANHVQMLPLKKTAYHEPGGAWRFGLTACMVALRYAETQMFFPNLESEDRRKLEPQCRFAAFAAVLSSAVALLAQNCTITVGDKGEEDEYHPLVSPVPLSAWLANHPTATFGWRAQEHPLTAPECAAIASRFIPNGLLAQFDLRVALMVFGAIAPQSPMNGLETTLAKVVRVSIAKVLEHYVQQDALKYQHGNPTQSIPSDGKAIADSLIATAKPRDLVNPLDTSVPLPEAVTPSPVNLPYEVTANPNEADAMLARASPVLRDWFAALTKHERYPTLKSHLVKTERGTEIPITMLGFFGVNGPTIKSMMTDAGMVVDRSADSRALILHPSLNHLLFGE